jgi:non-ribosomal peptide synthetase component F
VTPFALHLAAWADALHRRHGRAEVPVAVAVAGRETRDALRTVGTFVRTAMARLTLGGDPAEAVARTAAELAAARRRADVPLADVVARTMRARHRGAQPLAQTMVALQPAGPRRWVVGGHDVTLSVDTGVAERTGYDVVLNVLDDALLVDHRVPLVAPASVDALVRDWVAFVTAFAR